MTPQYSRECIDLYCADSVDVMNALPQVDCIITDPPYGIDYRVEGRDPIANDNVPPVWFVPPMARQLKPGGRLCLFTSRKVEGAWVDAIAEAGLTLRETIVWDKVNPWFNRRANEILLVADNGDVRRFNDDVDPIWNCPTVGDMELRKAHLTPKPVSLMVRALRKYAGQDELVFDPFMGCGPLAVASVRLNRRYIGVELQRAHFDSAVERVERAIEVRKALGRSAEAQLRVAEGGR